MQLRQLAVPAPRQRHIYGRIVEVLCAWSNRGTGAGRHRNKWAKMGTGASIIYTAADERCSYYGNASYLENIWDLLRQILWMDLRYVVRSSYDILTFVIRWSYDCLKTNLRIMSVNRAPDYQRWWDTSWSDNHQDRTTEYWHLLLQSFIGINTSKNVAKSKDRMSRSCLETIATLIKLYSSYCNKNLEDFPSPKKWTGSPK